MYLPYLRGDQFELLALRSFANRNPNCTTIIPIIEPINVKNNINDLGLAFKEMFAHRFKFAFILNPQERNSYHILDYDTLVKWPILTCDKGEWIPAYFYQSNSDDILEHAISHGLHNLMIIPTNGVDFEDKQAIDFLSNKDIRYLVISESPRSTRFKLIKFGKDVIVLKDHFKARYKDSDYLDMEDEFFSDDFAYFKDDQLWGYSDFLTIGCNDCKPVGMFPYSISIHLIYKKEKDKINVHHFVSDSNNDPKDTWGKYGEAVQKIESFYQERNLYKTPAVKELIATIRSYERFPGFGNLKKLSILNHLELINLLSQ